MTDPKSKDDLLKMKMPEIKKFVKKNKILTGYTNMRKAVLIGEILISKWWREREKQSAEKEEKKQAVEPISEMGGEQAEEKAVKKEKPKKIIDEYYSKELVDDYYSIMGKSLIPYERSDMKVPIDKYYENIEKQMDKILKSGKSLVVQNDPNGVIKLTGKAQKSVEKKPVEQKPVAEEKIKLVPKRATIEQKPIEFDIEQVKRDFNKMLPKEIESSEVILPTADVVIPTASPITPSAEGVKNILTNDQYINVIRNVRSEFDKFKNKLDDMLTLF